jgi:hypothetical protein
MWTSKVTVSMYTHTYWSQQLGNLATEMSRLSTVCDISIFDPGILERILKGDESVCGHKNPAVFRKLRRHLIVFYHIEEQASRRLGDEEVRLMLDEVLAALVRPAW